MVELVRKIGLSRIMRISQLLALVALYFEARVIFESSWNTMNERIVGLLLVFLVVSEFERLGKLLSIRALGWIGHASRTAGLGWAATAVVPLVYFFYAPDDGSDTIPSILFWSSGAFAVAVSVYAFTIGRTRIVQRKYSIGNPNAGTVLRISALSDLHLGQFVSAGHIRKAVEISNSQSPDIVLLLGDYVDHDGGLANELLAEITNLKAKHGVFAVLGNHDISATEPEQIIEQFEADETINLLRNSSAFIKPNHSGNDFSLQITGIESPAEWWGDATGSFADQVLRDEISETTADFTLIASHHPDIFELCAEYGADLIVAGHTHGGQLAVPYLGRWLNVGRLAAKYFWGLYERGESKLIVSAGVGVGILPARIGVPPEVTIIELGID